MAGWACGGLSFLVKLVGVYFVAEAHCSSSSSESRASPGESPDGQDRPSRFRTQARCHVGSLAFVALLILAFPVGSPDSTPPALSPSCCRIGAVAFMLVWREVHRPPMGPAARFRALLKLAIPFSGRGGDARRVVLDPVRRGREASGRSTRRWWSSPQRRLRRLPVTPWRHSA